MRQHLSLSLSHITSKIISSHLNMQAFKPLFPLYDVLKYQMVSNVITFYTFTAHQMETNRLLCTPSYFSRIIIFQTQSVDILKTFPLNRIIISTFLNFKIETNQHNLLFHCCFCNQIFFYKEKFI